MKSTLLVVLTTLSLIDIALSDVLVQPGYSQPGRSTEPRESTAKSSDMKDLNIPPQQMDQLLRMIEKQVTNYLQPMSQGRSNAPFAQYSMGQMPLGPMPFRPMPMAQMRMVPMQPMPFGRTAQFYNPMSLPVQPMGISPAMNAMGIGGLTYLQPSPYMYNPRMTGHLQFPRAASTAGIDADVDTKGKTSSDVAESTAVKEESKEASSTRVTRSVDSQVNAPGDHPFYLMPPLNSETASKNQEQASKGQENLKATKRDDGNKETRDSPMQQPLLMEGQQRSNEQPVWLQQVMDSWNQPLFGDLKNSQGPDQPAEGYPVSDSLVGHIKPEPADRTFNSEKKYTLPLKPSQNSQYYPGHSGVSSYSAKPGYSNYGSSVKPQYGGYSSSVKPQYGSYSPSNGGHSYGFNGNNQNYGSPSQGYRPLSNYRLGYDEMSGKNYALPGNYNNYNVYSVGHSNTYPSSYRLATFAVPNAMHYTMRSAYDMNPYGYNYVPSYRYNSQPIYAHYY